MAVADFVQRYVSDISSPTSLAGRSRLARWNELNRRFPDIEACTVLDLGGTSQFWRNAPLKPAHATVLNLGDDEAAESWITVVTGDACAPPPEIANRYDVVFSNSLIEHVGGHFQRLRMAEVVHARADRYWIQTPYRYFPVEPHWVAPGMQFLPFRARVEMSRRWPVGHYRDADASDAVDLVAEVELLSKTEMTRYFPDADLWWDRFAGLPKSMVAVRS